MPASSPLGKDVIKAWFEKQTDIKTILDVGAGEGTYRKLLGPEYEWIALEVWGEYVDRFGLRDLYNDVIIGDIRSTAVPKTDCVIFGDIIEHLDKKDGKTILEVATSTYKHVVVSIPLGEYEQGAIDGNPHEEHKATWTIKNMKKLCDWSVIWNIRINPDLPTPTMGIFIK